MEALLKALADNRSGSAGGDAARRKLYLDIISKGLAGDDENPTFAAFECHKAAILPVLLQDCRESCHGIQLSALELVGHLVAMASSFEAPAFQPSQASSVWGAIAKVLGDEDSKRMSKVLALFAISTNTMEPRLVAPSVAQLAPGVARSMRDESTVVRQQSAAAIHSLLGTAPGALALCEPGATDDPEEDTYWVRCLLRLCFDDAVLVRAGALSAAERAVSPGHLGGNAGVAAWVLKALRDGSLSESMKRVLFHNAGSPSSAAPNAAGPLAEGIDASEPPPATATAETPPRQATPQRVKQAIRAWAVYLSLADMASLLQTRSDGQKKLMDDGTSLLSWLSGKFADSRESVRMQAVEAWEMFTVNMVAQMSRNNGGSRSGYDQARKVAQMFLTSFHRLALRDRNAAVREGATTSLSRLVASCPSQLIKPFWAPTPKGRGKKGNGVAEVLQQLAGGRSGEVAQHQCARLLAALLPSFCQGPMGSGTEPHPSLQSASITLVRELPRLLSILETLMKAFQPPLPEEAASAIDSVAPRSPPPSCSTRSREPGEDTTIRLEALPTTGLIVSAWCGLAFWAMDQAVAAAAAAAADGAGATDTSDIRALGDSACAAAPAGDESPAGSNGGRKGKGKLKPTPPPAAPGAAPAAPGASTTGHQQACSAPSISSATPPRPQAGAGDAATSEPLMILLGWLLRPGADRGDAEVPGVTKVGEPGSTGGSGGAADGGGKSARPATADAAAAVAPKDKLARWKSALLGALVRGLSRRLTLSRAKATLEGNNPDVRPPEQGWLDTPLDASFVDPETPATSTSGVGAVCPDCALAGNVIRKSVLSERGEDEVPLVSVLLGGVLRGRCGLGSRCERGMDGGGFGGGSQGGGDSGGGGGNRRGGGGGDGGRGRGGSIVCVSSSHATEGTLGNMRCRAPILLPQALLTEALALLPSGGAGRVLKSLSCSVLSAEKGVQEEQDSALMLLGRLWRAEATRIVYAWEGCRLSSPNSSRGTSDVVFDGTVQGNWSGEGAYRSVSAALREGPRDGADGAKERENEHYKHQPRGSLRSDTAFALRFLLQTASSLFSRPPPGANWGRWDDGQGIVSSTPVGHACDQAKSDAVRDGHQGELCEVADAAHSKELGGGRARRFRSRCNERRLAAIRSAFGAESATLWRELFEARRNSHIEPDGVSRLLKAIAKDCARCALSSPKPGAAAPSSGGKGGGSGRSPEGPPLSELEDRSSVGWGLEFSQTQSQQQQQRSSRRDSRERGDVRARGTDGIASTTQGQNSSAAVARDDRGNNNSGHARKRRERTRSGDDPIAPPPPFFALPVLTAAALTLLTAATKEQDAKLRAWKAGLATLAWTLTAATPLGTQPPPQQQQQQLPTSNSSAPTAVTAPAVAEGDRVIVAGVCRCLAAVRSALAAVKIGSTTAGSIFSFDKVTLTPVCRLLAVALSTSRAAASTTAGASRGASGPGVLLQTAASASTAADSNAARAEAVVAAIPSVRGGVRALVVYVLSAARKLAPSPALLWALSPMLEAVLDLPASSDADSLQSSLLDMWNATFGKVNVDLNLPPSSAGARDGSNPGRTDQLVSWADAFSASLLRRLSTLSRRAEVKMPLGVLLPAGHDSDVAAAEAATEEARRGFGVSDDHSKEKESAEGDGEGGVGGKGEREISLQAAETAAVERCLSGAAAGRGHATAAAVRSGGVAGALPVEGARRSFIRQASGSPPPDRGTLATPRKRSPSPASRAGNAGGSAGKFVRVIGSGRGSSNKTPAKRAAVTTHTSLDASQSMAPWEDGSQLPDTEPDSVPDLPPEERQLPPPPPKDGLCAPPRPPPKEMSTPMLSAIDSTSPGKRSIEEAESVTFYLNKTAPSPTGTAPARGDVDAVSSPDTASERRVRPRTESTAPSHAGGTATTGFVSTRGGDASRGESAGGAAEAASAAGAVAPARKSGTGESDSAKRLEATMAAISKASNSSSSNSGGEAREEEDEDDDDDDDDDDDVDAHSETSGITPSVQRASSDRGPAEGGGGGGGGSNIGVNELLQDVRSLTRRLEAAKPALSPEQFEEVGALLKKIVER